MQKFIDAIRLALAAIWAGKLRSFMTVLGNIVAVTSIIAVVSLIRGMNSYVSDAILSDVGAGLIEDRALHRGVEALNQRHDGDDRRHRDDVAEHGHERPELGRPDRRQGDHG